MAGESTYQPQWDELRERDKRKHHHHHHHHQHTSDDRYSNGWGGAMKMRDKQAYYGLMFIVIAVLAFGAYKVVMMFVHEWRAMPHDDPTTEVNVDELGIRKADEQDAILLGDSLVQQYNLDSVRRHVQIDTRAPYRPPRKENTWYITQREWKDIWKQWQRKRYEKKLEKEKKE